MGFLIVDRGLSLHVMVEHKMYCRSKLAAELSKDWSKAMSPVQGNLFSRTVLIPRNTLVCNVSFMVSFIVDSDRHNKFIVGSATGTITDYLATELFALLVEA